MDNLITGACLGECYANLPPEAEIPDQEFIERKMEEMTVNDMNYFLWMPGYKYQMSLKQRIDTARSSSTVETGDLIEQPVVEESELQQVFNSKAVSGKVSIDDVANLLRKLGYAPTQAELKESVQLFGNSIDYSQFQDLYKALGDSAVNINQLEQALGFFDTSGSGKLSKDQWINILMNYGEPLTKDEMDMVNKKFSIGEFVDYKIICEDVTS